MQAGRPAQGKFRPIAAANRRTAPADCEGQTGPEALRESLAGSLPFLTRSERLRQR